MYRSHRAAVLRTLVNNTADVQMRGRLRLSKWLLFQLVFRAWAASTTESQTAVQSYRALGLYRIYYGGFQDRTFHHKLEQLHRTLRDLVMGETGRLLQETWGHFASLPFSAIKVLSYSGAVLRCSHDGTPRRWKWTDPGNHAYCVLWYLIRKTARHISSTCPGLDQPRRLLDSMMLCQKTWPRGPTRFPELVGDLIEAALALGYIDGSLEHVVMDLSPVAHWIHMFPQVLSTNCGIAIRATHLDPYQLADAILCARGGHSTGDWTSFLTVVGIRESTIRDPRL